VRWRRAWEGDVPDSRYSGDAVGWEGYALGFRQNGGVDVGRKRNGSQLGTEEARQAGLFPVEVIVAVVVSPRRWSAASVFGDTGRNKGTGAFPAEVPMDVRIAGVKR